MMDKQKILIVDDDENIAELISLYLEKECYETKIASDGIAAVEAQTAWQPDLMILDLMLPGKDGYQVCREVRQNSLVPIIMLSAKTEVFDKVLGLELGADDYMIKPFDTKELLARIAVQLRAPRYEESKNLKFKNLCLDLNLHTVTANEQASKLTRTEYAILKLLMQNPKQVITKAQLLERISEDTPDCTESSLKTHVSNLRRKLREIGGEEYVEAVWGIGFKMKE